MLSGSPESSHIFLHQHRCIQGEKVLDMGSGRSVKHLYALWINGIFQAPRCAFGISSRMQKTGLNEKIPCSETAEFLLTEVIKDKILSSFTEN